MTTLYTWVPTPPPVLIADRIVPDVGHSALEITDGGGRQVAYVSFWPERESLIGELTRRVKPRKTRHPSCYAEESDPAAGFMQRPAEFMDRIAPGLDEERMAAAWQAIVESQYDFLHWNCSNVTRFLITRAMAPADYDAIQEAATLTGDDLRHISGPDGLREIFRYLATSRFIDCRPDDVRRLVHAFNARKAAIAAGGG